MKLSFNVEVTRKELNLIKAYQSNIVRIAMAQPNLGKDLQGMDVHKEVEKLFPKFEIKMDSKSAFHNAQYLFHIKETVKLNIEVELGAEYTELYLNMSRWFAETTLPVVDSIIGVFLALNKDKLLADLHGFNSQFKELTKDSSYTEQVKRGEEV